MKYWNDYSGFVIKTLYSYLNKYFKKYQFNYDAYKKDNSPLVKKFGKFIEALKNLYEGNSFDRIICDYIAGMTDNYALNCFENILLCFTIIKLSFWRTVSWEPFISGMVLLSPAK